MILAATGLPILAHDICVCYGRASISRQVFVVSALFLFFLTEEAQSHGGLQTRKLSQTH